MANRDQVAAIRQAWRELHHSYDEDVIDFDLYAQVAINVLTDWDKRVTINMGNHAASVADYRAAYDYLVRRRHA